MNMLSRTSDRPTIFYYVDIFAWRDEEEVECFEYSGWVEGGAGAGAKSLASTSFV